MKPAQLVTLAALTSALPPPGSAVPGPNPEDAMPVLPVTTVASAPPAAPVAVPVKLAATPDRMASVEALLRTLPSHGTQHHAHIRRETAFHEYAQNRPAENGGSALAPIAMSAQPLGAQVMSVRAVSPAPPPPAYGGSVLGMAQGGSSN